MIEEHAVKPKIVKTRVFAETERTAFTATAKSKVNNKPLSIFVNSGLFLSLAVVVLAHFIKLRQTIGKQSAG
jgi:hypothetical protein